MAGPYEAVATAEQIRGPHVWYLESSRVVELRYRSTQPVVVAIVRSEVTAELGEYAARPELLANPEPLSRRVFGAYVAAQQPSGDAYSGRLRVRGHALDPGYDMVLVVPLEGADEPYDIGLFATHERAPSEPAYGDHGQCHVEDRARLHPRRGTNEAPVFPLSEVVGEETATGSSSDEEHAAIAIGAAGPLRAEGEAVEVRVPIDEEACRPAFATPGARRVLLGLSDVWAAEAPPIYDVHLGRRANDPPSDPVGEIALYSSWPMPRPGTRLSFAITEHATALGLAGCADVTVRLEPRAEEEDDSAAPQGDDGSSRTLEVGRIEIFVAP